MRRHVKRVRRIGRDFGIAASGFQSLRRELGSVRGVNQVMDRARMLRLRGRELVQDGDYLLMDFCVVVRERKQVSCIPKVRQ